MKFDTLYYGDNLFWMREWEGGSVDLIYLDPPFNSKVNYSVLFGSEKEITRTQVFAFKDTWQWGEQAVRDYEDALTSDADTGNCMRGLRQVLRESGMLAYLSHLAPRLVEMRRLLKETGSIYFHCDSTASHYIKILMDSIFGYQSYGNEIIWHYKRWSAGDKHFQRMHDVIFRYCIGKNAVFNIQFQQYSNKTIHRHWSVDGVTNLSMVRDEGCGTKMDDVWDLPYLHSQSKERLGYPTQKPEALLERIICASSREGDVVLDPYCGCGTTVHVARRLGRRYIGIDITHLAISVIEYRFRERLGEVPCVVGKPEDLDAAKDLFSCDPFQFEAWALSLIPGFLPNERKGKDRGIDGRGYAIDRATGKHQLILAQVKGGSKLTPSVVRDLVGTVEGHQALLGVLVVMERKVLTRGIREALAQGTVEFNGKQYLRFQSFTVEDYFLGYEVDLPNLLEPYTGRMPYLWEKN